MSDGSVFEALVKNIRTEADLVHNKQYTELEPIGENLTVGDRVEVHFEKKNTEKININTVIPNTALITKYGETGVYVLENGQTKYQIITIIASDGNISAINGLTTGQKVITKGKENILDGEVLR